MNSRQLRKFSQTKPMQAKEEGNSNAFQLIVDVSKKFEIIQPLEKKLEPLASI